MSDDTQAHTQQQDAPEVPETQEVQVQTPNLIKISDAQNRKARWYVVHTYSGHENKVAETLKQRAETLNLLDKILGVLIPYSRENSNQKRSEKNCQ